ncbi:hypothetical protein QE152_g7009 [Popillia japonica]|uniref:Uncharacterized protein n=1 Tax=Popillia japonica TaxID=7064 RepID=A0AAW1MGQ1_POPJA
METHASPSWRHCDTQPSKDCQINDKQTNNLEINNYTKHGQGEKKIRFTEHKPFKKEKINLTQVTTEHKPFKKEKINLTQVTTSKTTQMI